MDNREKMRELQSAREYARLMAEEEYALAWEGYKRFMEDRKHIEDKTERRKQTQSKKILLNSRRKALADAHADLLLAVHDCKADDDEVTFV